MTTDSYRIGRITLRIGATAMMLLAGAACSGRSPAVTASPTSPTATPTTPTPAPETVTPPASAAPCRSEDVLLSIGGGDGAAGTTYVRLVLTNTSNDPCSVKGSPTVQVVDEHSEPLGEPAEHDEVKPAERVTLEPRGSAFATMAFPNESNFEPGRCTKTGASLKVTLPGESTPRFLPSRYASCPGFRVSALSAEWN